MTIDREKIPLDVAKELVSETEEHVSCGEKCELKCGQTFIMGNFRYFDFIYLCHNCNRYFVGHRKSL